MMADKIPDSVEGNLYKITLGRITNITEEDDICQEKRLVVAILKHPQIK